MNTLKAESPWYLTTQGKIALLALSALLLSLLLRILGASEFATNLPLFLAYLFGGSPLVKELFCKALKGEFGSDLLAGISILTSLALTEYLAGVLVILMLSGGEALENYALKRASSVLDALAKRMPHRARKRSSDGVTEVSLEEITIGDHLELLPHDICPVDGRVIEGRGNMDEAYLTGEPYAVEKIPGSEVISGAINGETLLTIEATALPIDSRYQKIAKVIELQSSKQVPMRRIGDRLGAWYTPLAVAIAAISWFVAGDPKRFLSVIVIATPCPLLIAIPVAIIGAISNAAKRGIIIKDPSALEETSSCRTIILDKTGTLTYGTPMLTEVDTSGDFASDDVLHAVSSLEVYSKHPLAEAVREAAKVKNLKPLIVSSVSEQPGTGLRGICEGREIRVLGRGQVTAMGLEPLPHKVGLECHVVIDGKLAAALRFKDVPRLESRTFVDHLGIHHGITKVMILSGDRDVEVRRLAELVGIKDVTGGLSPEEKLNRVILESTHAPTLYIGDGINDAPALQAATVGIALGTKSDITSEAADVVILEQSLVKVDEFIHLSNRMREIALQSAIGGMALSIVGMSFAAFGFLTPLAGAILQEVIDVVAVVNALRTAALNEEAHKL